MNHTNVLGYLTSENHDGEVLKLNYFYAINALTSALVSETMSYVQRTKRGEEFDGTLIGNPEANREDDFSDSQRNEQGFNTRNPRRNMAILQGIRFHLYEEYQSMIPNLPGPYEVLNTTLGGDHNIPGWILPQSAAQIMDFRVQNEGQVSASELANLQISRPTDPEDQLRELLQVKKLRQQAQLRELGVEVITEIDGMEVDECDESAFTGLPIDLQMRIIDKIWSKLDAKDRKLAVATSGNQRRSLANKSDDLVSLRAVVKANADELERLYGVLQHNHAAEMRA